MESKLLELIVDSTKKQKICKKIRDSGLVTKTYERRFIIYDLFIFLILN